MDVTEQKTCDNCHTILHGAFCHQCGQEKKSYIRNVSGVITEFFGEFSNWDTRVWQTLIPLWFRPGFLSRRYVAGHRVPYVPPLRLYLFTSIVAFLIFARLVPDVPVTVNPATEQLENAASQPKSTFSQVMDDIRRDIGQEKQQQQKPFDSEIGFLSDSAQSEFDKKLEALIANPKLAINKFFSLAPQMMFLLLPLFALLLKLLYIRSDRYYMEHLIVALHSHSFILQMSALYLGLNALSAVASWPWLADVCGFLASVTLIWIPVYLFLCQKFYYQQGWLKTALKFWLTSSLYNVLFVAAIMGLIILSILWS